MPMNSASAHSPRFPPTETHDARTAWRRWYSLKRWADLRLSVLRAQPLCAMCATRDRVTPAEIVDHVTPHRGDAALFWDAGNLQSLCKRCHDSDKQVAERGGMCDADGYPTD